MRMRHFLGAVGVLALLVLPACSSPDPVDDTHNGDLQDSASDHDGRKCDEYTIEVGSGWNVDVRMNSEWDNYVYLASGGEDVASNDDGDEGLNAHLTHTVDGSGSYTVYACAYSDGRGAYTLHIQANGG